MADSPSCFISYSWDSSRHQAWVAKLAEALAINGVQVHLDTWETHLGMDLPQYMERSIRDSQYVLLICTPRYAERANSREGGVGYETGVVTADLFSSLSSTKKFAPVLRGRDPKLSLPTYLRGKKYLDARSTRRFQTYLKELLHHVWAQPLHKPPQVGAAPDLSKPRMPQPPEAGAARRVGVRARRVRDVRREIERKEKALAKLQSSPLDSAAADRPGEDRAGTLSQLTHELDVLHRRYLDERITAEIGLRGSESDRQRFEQLLGTRGGIVEGVEPHDETFSLRMKIPADLERAELKALIRRSGLVLASEIR